VKLVDYLSSEPKPAPPLIAPSELPRIHYLGWSVRSLRLKARCWIRIELGPAVESKAITLPRANPFDEEAEVTPAFFAKR
jgi:hypothetical protein